MADARQAPISLSSINPEVSSRDLAATLVPPPQFENATFDSYRPDPEYPSQAEAVEKLRGFFSQPKAEKRGLFKRSKPQEQAKPGVYLDGGFGVGKTHLLAALWHRAHGRKYFGTFIEYTALVGALGYQRAVETLRGASFLAIDEFELDDPGDTMVMTRLLGELVASGTKIAATSNTPPNALGEGRFAAADFLREIQAIADRFEIMRIDGVDYRRRHIEGHAASRETSEVEAWANDLAAAGQTVTLDTFDDVISHLSTVHPSKFVQMVKGIDAIAITGVHELRDQSDALRLVAFIDRVYDAQIPVTASGTPLDEVFGDDMLSGGYRKKYLRAMSRMIALTTSAGE